MYGCSSFFFFLLFIITATLFINIMINFSKTNRNTIVSNNDIPIISHQNIAQKTLLIHFFNLTTTKKIKTFFEIDKKQLKKEERKYFLLFKSRKKWMRYDRVSCIAFQVKRQVNKTIENCVVELFDLIIKKNCKKKRCDIMPITMLFSKAMLDYCRHCFDNAIFNVSEICTTFCYARFSWSMSSVEFFFHRCLRI